MASPEDMDESQAVLREALEEKGEGQGGPYTQEGQHQQVYLRGQKTPCSPWSARRVCFCGQCNKISWDIRSGCFRVCRTQEGPAPMEKGAVCNSLQATLIRDADRNLEC